MRQNEDEADYKEFLKHMRTGTMTMDDCKWMISKCHDAIDLNELATFNNALHICPTWKVANRIFYHYLQNDLTEPIAILRAELGTNKENGKTVVPKVMSCPFLLQYVWVLL